MELVLRKTTLLKLFEDKSIGEEGFSRIMMTALKAAKMAAEKTSTVNDQPNKAKS